MKKIGLYLGIEPGGGSFQYCQSILDALNALPRNKYIPLVGYSSSVWEKYLSNYDIKSKYIQKSYMSRVITSLWFRLGLPIAAWRKVAPYIDGFTKSFQRNKCDLWIIPSQHVLAYRLPLPTLGVIHDLMHRYESQFPEVSEDGEYERREELFSNTCKYAKGILVDSKVGKEQVVESYQTSSNKLHVLPFIPPSYIFKDKNAFSQDYKLPEKFIFYPAQFWTHKNHKALISVAKSLLSKLPDFKLVFVGSKKNGYNDTVRLVKELGLEKVIYFAGYVPDNDMIQLYKKARALVMPTFFGPTNIPPLEAFALECPVAVSNIYGMPEQVKDAALLFDPKSEKELEDAMARLWTDEELCHQLIKKGKERLLSWGVPQFNKRLEEIIDEVVADVEPGNIASV